jgi:hypothetical protein
MGPDLVPRHLAICENRRTSSTMLHTSLSAKKSSPVNCKLFTAPFLSKKRIAAALREESIVPGIRHPCLLISRDRCPLDDNLATVVRPDGLRPLNATQRRGLNPAREGRETDPVRDVGHGIPVHINLDLVNVSGAKASAVVAPSGFSRSR